MQLKGSNKANWFEFFEWLTICVLLSQHFLLIKNACIPNHCKGKTRFYGSSSAQKLNFTLQCWDYSVSDFESHSLRYQPSVKTFEVLAKILHILTYSGSVWKVLIRSCLILIHTNLLKFLIGILARVLSRVSRELM